MEIQHLRDRVGHGLTFALSDLTATCWLLDLAKVAACARHLPLVRDIDDSDEVEEAVEAWRLKSQLAGYWRD